MSGESTLRVLLCRLPACVIALPLEHVIETMRPLAIEPLSATAPAFVKGVSVIRGLPVPVVDTARLLGAAAATGPTPSMGRRFVTVRSGGRTVALAFDEVIGIRTLPSDTVRELPPLLQRAESDAVTAIGALDDQLLIVLRTASIVPEDLA